MPSTQGQACGIFNEIKKKDLSVNNNILGKFCKILLNKNILKCIFISKHVNISVPKYFNLVFPLL